MRGAVLLENNLGRVRHPEHLRLFGRSLTLIDDPVTRPIAEGHPAMGWEGDGRLALYADPVAKQWVLVRLELDGQYRRVAGTTLHATHTGAIDIVGQLIGFLVSHDTRRGFDVIADVDRHNNALERRHEAELSDRVVNDLAPRLRHALVKGGIDGWR